MEDLRGKEVIYRLRNPQDNTVFYVGRTNNIQRRTIEHLTLRGYNAGLHLMIATLFASGIVPCIDTLEIVDSGNASLREAYYIAEYSSMGTLVNC